MTKSLFEAILRYRVAVLIVVGALTTAAAVLAARVEYDSSVEIWFLDDDPDLLVYHTFLEHFDADEITVVGVFAEDVFAPAVLASIDRITRAAEAAPHVHRVRSLTNIRLARGTQEGVEIGRLVRRLPESPAEAEPIRRAALASDTLRGTMISDDGTATAIVVEMSPDGADFAARVEHVAALRQIAAREEQQGTLTAHLAGSPALDEAFFRYGTRDFRLFGPLTALIVVVCIVAVFRRLSAVVVPLAVVTTSLTWLFGVMGALHLKINLVSTILPTLVLAVGVADSIHVLADYEQERARGVSRHDAAVLSATRLLLPCLFTSATTAAGMLALLTSHLQPIRELGCLAALAVAMAFVLSMVLGPILLLLAGDPALRSMQRHEHGLLARLLGWLGRPTRRSSRVVVLASAGLVVLSLWAVGGLRVGSNAMTYFRPDDPVRLQLEAVDRALGGSVSLEMLVQAGEEGLKDPAKLRQLDRLGVWLESLPAVTRSLSVIDGLEELHAAFDPDKDLGNPAEGPSRLPQSRALISQLYLLMEGEEDFDSQVQDNYSVGRVTARARFGDAHELANRIPELEAELATVLQGTGLQAHSTGFVKLLSKMEVYLLQSQISSLSIAFAVITLMLLLLLRSVRLALLSMIPNFLPIVVGLAAMAALDIPLDPGTVMIGSVALGLVVDDTVHFLVRLRRSLQAGDSLERAIEQTTLSAGRPILVTSIVLAGGFLVLLLASFTPNVHFGAVIAVVILLALVADVVVLPAVLLVLRPRLAPVTEEVHEARRVA